MFDKNNVLIEIGDIVKIDNSPIKADNCLSVVIQDGTSDLYSDKKNITLHKVTKYKEGYALSLRHLLGVPFSL